MRKLLLFIGDILALGLAFLFVVWKEGHWQIVSHVVAIHAIPFLCLGIVTVILLYAVDLYDFRYARPVANNLWRIAAAAGTSFVIGAIFFYTIPIFRITPKTNLVIFFGLFSVLFIVWRRFFAHTFSRVRMYPIVFWTPHSAVVESLITDIELHPERGYTVVARSDSVESLTQYNPKLLVIADNAVIPEHILSQLFEQKVSIESVSHFYERYFMRVPPSVFEHASFVYDVRHRNAITHFLYRCCECLIALFTLVVTSPFLVIAAMCINLEDGGPVFYTHKRLGFLGKEFTLYKFRSMKIGTTDNFGEWRTKGDPRATKVGRIISKLHIDEIPQMLNVLKGDMAIVGPRPDMVSIAHGFQAKIPQYHLRLLVKPGFTGWAQIKYINPQTTDQYETKLEYDLYYIKHQEPFLDIGILLRTIQIIFSHF